MKFERVLMVLTLGLALGWGLGATSEPTKIGFVDAQQVLTTIESGKAAQDELERKAREAQQRITPMLEELESKQKELQAKQFVMSKEALAEKQRRRGFRSYGKRGSGMLFFKPPTVEFTKAPRPFKTAPFKPPPVELTKATRPFKNVIS